MHDDLTSTPVVSAEVPTPDSGQSRPAKLPLRELLPLMLKTALSPNKLVLLVVFLAAAAVCARLGVWQLDRAYERANLAKQHELAEAASAEAVPLGEVLLPQAPFGGSLVGKDVTVSGTYEPQKQLLVAGRSVNNQEGFLVLNSLLVQDDGSDGASWADLSSNPRIPVVRGWIPLDAVDDAGALTPEWAERLAVGSDLSVGTNSNSGQTQIRGWLQASESSLTLALPPGQTMSISSAMLANEWGGPSYGGYLVAQSSTPADSADLVMLPRPSIEGGDGLNLQNMFYALQWWVFGLFAVALWLRLVRDDALRAQQDKPVNPFDILDAQSS